MRTTHPRQWTALIDGRYALTTVIGRGGMGEVWAGTDRLLGRAVAVKVMHEHLALDAAARNRFDREARAVASLNHPRIAAVYDAGALPGTPSRPYMVMEFVEGHTVADLLSDVGPPPAELAVEWVSGILDALECAHAAGIVHRDIKPANVMVTRAGAVKVLDFGIVRVAWSGYSAATATHSVIGTAAYMAPEQAQGQAVDARSDLYSVGCLFYELLTGRPPHTGEAPLAILYGHVHESPVPPSARNADLPQSLDAVVLRALAKEPENRFFSAADMRQALVRLDHGFQEVREKSDNKTLRLPGGGDVHLRHPATAHRARPRRRASSAPSAFARPVLLWAAALSAAAGAVAVAWSSSVDHDGPPPNARPTATPGTTQPASASGSALSSHDSSASSGGHTPARGSDSEPATSRTGAAPASGGTSATTQSGGSASVPAPLTASSTTQSPLAPLLPPPPPLPTLPGRP
jgi:serine/threonine-protein kinase